MSLTFRPPQAALDAALAKLKSDGLVHPDAAFNPDAPDGLRREVAPHDYDFLCRLGRWDGDEVTVDAALEFLSEHGLIEPGASYDKDAFGKHCADVDKHFKGSWSSITRAMSRLMYALTSVRRPAHMVELGSFWGYTLAWFAGPCIGAHRAYEPERIVGIELDVAMHEKAKENFAKLPNTERIDLIGEDARTALDRVPGPIDFLYIEAKDDNMVGCYLELLKKAYDKLSPGAWVMAHDNLDWTFTEEMAVYLPYVRDKARFRESISFDVDQCGIELSIK